MNLSVENGAATLMVLNNGSPDIDFIELWPGAFTPENLTELMGPSFGAMPTISQLSLGLLHSEAHVRKQRQHSEAHVRKQRQHSEAHV